MNQKDKNKGAISIADDIKREAAHIMIEFDQFTDNYHVLFLLQRHKDGGDVNNTKLKKIIVYGKKEYQEALEELLAEQQKSDKTLRIYASLNERDFKKAIRKFKREQLDAEEQQEFDHHGFYRDVRNRFIGCLMQPGQRASSWFLWDVDTKDDQPFLAQLPAEIPVLLKYPTKKGWHIITPPFNYTKMVLPPDVELKKDGLLLLKWQVI